MSELKIPAYRLPCDPMGAIRNSVTEISTASNNLFEPHRHPPHLTLLRQSLFGGRVGIDVSTLHQALLEQIETPPESYSLPVRGIENTTRSLSKAAVLAIILDDPFGKYEDEYSSIRSKLPERIRGKVVTNIPHITLGRMDSSYLTNEVLAKGEDALPSEINFGPLLFSSAIMKYHDSFKLSQRTK